MNFEFGKNWEAFSRRALTESDVAQAQEDFLSLLNGVELTDRTFFDIGFGQGLSLLHAAAGGARVAGCDSDPDCLAALYRTARFFPQINIDQLRIVVGSILDAHTIDRIRASAEAGFDVVHAWGVLHHTGNLRRSIEVAAAQVAPEGHLVLAIYNRHWSSPAWRKIKRIYCSLPTAGKRAMVSSLYPLIWLAKLIATRQNPWKKERGMNFYHDVIDWVGGYPYECAKAADVEALLNSLGMTCISHRPPRVPTGCNEFVFKKRSLLP